MNINEINPSILAYIGDSVYELKIRNYLVSRGINKVNDLQTQSVNYVSANSQAEILDKLIKKNLFTKEELYTIGRARNYNPNNKARHASIKNYKKATALEALFGMLYLQNNLDRINNIMKEIIGD